MGFRVYGFGVEGVLASRFMALGFRVWGLGFLGFRWWGFTLRAQGLLIGATGELWDLDPLKRALNLSFP